MTDDFQQWNWTGLNDAVSAWFQGAASQDIYALEGNMDAWLRHLAQDNDLTIAETAELIGYALTVAAPDMGDLRAA